MKSKAAVRRIIEELKVLYPDARCSLEYQKDYELLFAVRLSAQCTDARVNMVTPALYARFPTLEAFANASYEEVGEAIKSCGFYNTKSKDLVECAKILLEKYGGRVPGTMEELTSLPGIGRKTANLILGDIYHQPAYVCDTHCIRITGRLGLTDGSKDPLSVEKQLRQVLPPEESSDFCHRMVLFGRDICTARKANCGSCPLKKDCDYGKSQKYAKNKQAPRGSRRAGLVSLLVVEFAGQDVFCRAHCVAVAALDGHVDRLLAALKLHVADAVLVELVRDVELLVEVVDRDRAVLALFDLGRVEML